MIIPKVGRRAIRVLRHDAGSVAFVAVTLSTITVTAVAAILNYNKSGWSSDVAAWAQAGGSILAIAGAAWLASHEARRARRARLRDGEEAAGYVRFAIVQAQFDSQIVANELVNRDQPVDVGDIRCWRQRVRTSATSLTALVARTDHLRPAVTQVTANAKVLIDDMLDDLAELRKAVAESKPTQHDLVADIASTHRALKELVELYDERMQSVRCTSTFDRAETAAIKASRCY